MIDNASKQLVYVNGADHVRDMGEYEICLQGGVNVAIGSGPSSTVSQLSDSGPQDCLGGSPHITCKVDDRLHKINIYEGARIDDLSPGIRLDDTVVQLKQVLAKLEDARPEDVLLTFQCGRLHDNRTLRQYGIKAGAELDVQMPLCSAEKSSRATAHVFVTNMLGRTMRVNVMSRNGPHEVAGCRLTDTVGRLKEAVCYLDGIPPCEQRLIFAGNQLDDNKTLAYYNIQNNSTIHIVLKLKGC